MNAIDREGTFLFEILDSGVSYTSNQNPQFVANLQAKALWDEEAEEWIDWADEDQGIIAYLVLFGADGTALANVKQLKKALELERISIKILGGTDFTGKLIQGRVQSSTYKEKTRLKVEWVDHQEATPGYAVQKVEDDELAKLDAKFAKQFKEINGVEVNTASSKPKPKTKSKPKSGDKGTGSSPPKPKSRPPKNKAKATVKVTRDSVWDEIIKTGADEEEVADAWTGAWDEIVGGSDEATEEQLIAVRDKVLDTVLPF
jgi:hypothetical protein